MLERLIIRDLALVERAEITFGSGLNVLTGETGAGKTLVIDAMNLVVGERASAESIRTGGAERNEAYLADLVGWNDATAEERALCIDPQTSGGLLVSCAPDAASAALDIFQRHGCDRATKIGVMASGPPSVQALYLYYSGAGKGEVGR